MKTSQFLPAFALLSAVLFAAPAVAHGLSGNEAAETGPEMDSGGNGMAKMDHFDLYTEEGTHQARKEARRENWDARHDEQGSREREEKEFVALDESVPGLRGLQTATVLNGLHHLNMKEIELAKMAESTAKSDDVLNIAHRLRADHEQLEKKVEALASQRDIALEPFRLAEPEQVVVDRLKNLKGADFEAAFLRVMAHGHFEAEHMLRMAQHTVRDPEVHALLNETLPVITAHAHALHQENRARAAEEEGNLGE